MRPLILVLAMLAVAGCREEIAEVPEPVQLTEENVSFFCQMNVLEHGGPKAQIHLDGSPAPIFFAQVRDAVAYLKSPERDARILATYVSDMGAAESWSQPGTDNWVGSDDAVYVIEAGVAGGMGAPEIVPFAEIEAANVFSVMYGGRIVAFADIPDEVALGAVDPGAGLEVPQ